MLVLRISSIDDLFENEEEILRRINEAPNGPNLYVIHPLRALADLGIELSDEARQSLVRREPGLAALSITAYEALMKSKKHQLVRFHIKALFRR